MTQILLLYLVTAVVFFGLDMIGIRLLIRPVFDRHIGDLLASPPRLLPAAVFYLCYIAGLMWFVSVPALKEASPLQALLGGAILGALCYGTYEFTSYAVMRDWSAQQVITDLLWGTLLTGVSAWAGVALLSGRLA
ncbi:DUF2177 family protein [Pseudodonghicola flavimaris]|uniref:DUF2177 family protein n=1 Tax=Pseudodonghicola flavimaris TaxID=3050036 RepID=A0ABT7F1W0_9RHOB|nr:DUF2177 family protein [Pseudodonghicola flavimaris]MDK3018594.1 DUF2177 family protein [Pseudodonghicola flavimaris]